MPATTLLSTTMPPEIRALLPHLAVVAALVDGAAVVALGLHSYPGVVAFAALFALTVPAFYAVAERSRSTEVNTPTPEQEVVGHRQR
jgi:membrane protein implicated in regulation of membrane protease activity